jgi:hypothetical protein
MSVMLMEYQMQFRPMPCVVLAEEQPARAGWLRLPPAR